MRRIVYRVSFAILALLASWSAYRDAEAAPVWTTCSAAVIPCPAGLTCTYSFIYTCVTSGAGAYGSCVTGASWCLFSTHQCNGTLTTGGSCYCYGSDLGPNAC